MTDAPAKTRKKKNPNVGKRFEDEVVLVEDKVSSTLHRGVWVAPKEGEDPVRHQVQITDFGLDVLCVHERDEKRVIKLTVTHDGRVFTRDLDSKTLERPELFNAWATEFGGVCNLDRADIWGLKKYLRSREGWSRVISSPSYAGYNTEHGVWLTADVSIDCDGNPHTVLAGDATGEMLCRDGLFRDFILPRGVTGMPRVVHYGSPFHPEQWAKASAEARLDLSSFMAAMRANLGSHGGSLALGWMVAQLARDVVIADENAFPHLYIFGAKGSGKDTLVKWLMEVAGLKHVNAMRWGDGTSMVYVRNHLTQVSCAPMWINELRNDDEHRKLMGIVRSTFDNQAGGVSGGQGSVVNKEFPPRRGLILSGQSVLGDDAEFSRYVLIETHKEMIRREMKPAVLERIPKARVAFARIMATRNKWERDLRQMVQHYKELLLTRLHEFMPEEGHRQQDIEDRQAMCFAVSLAGLAVAMNTDATYMTKVLREGSGTAKDVLHDAFIVEAFERLLDSKSLVEDMGLRGQFWQVVASLSAEKRLRTRWITTVDVGGRKCYAIWLDHLCFAVTRETRNKDFDRRLLLAEFRDQPGYVSSNQSYEFGRLRHPAIVFETTCPAVPEFARQVAAGDLDREEDEMPGRREVADTRVGI